MNIGIMGGTFDPLHIGHLIVAEQARERMPLDEIWFMPSYQPPHKETSPGADSLHRLEMVKQAIVGHPYFRLCEIEFERGGTSYTIDTALWLTNRYPEHRFYWIIGSDMVAYLPKWYRINELIKLISFIGFKRPGFELADLSLSDMLREALVMLDMPQFDISSTDIRTQLAQGRSVRYLVPDPILSYIKEHRLYEP